MSRLTLPDPRPRFVVTFRGDPHPSVEFPLSLERSPVLGRHRENPLCLAHPTVARKHLQLSRDPSSGAVVVTDLNSSSGIFIDDERASGPRPLRPGQVLTFAQFSARIVEGENPTRMGLLLVREAGKPADQFCALDPADRTLVGRDEAADLTAVDDQLARHHCSVYWGGERYVLEDFNSANGVFVKGERVRERRLAPFDRIDVGASTFVFVPTGGLEEVRKAETGSRPWWST